MRRVSLSCHPTTPGAAIRAVEVEFLPQEAGRLTLRYILRGDMAALRLPEKREAQRTDELWRHTCCELFVGSSSGEAYCEFNFSPSTEWAAYRFQSYRQGMQTLQVDAPCIHVRREEQVLLLGASVDFGDEHIDEHAPLALTAVIEETDGRLSYWALRHPEGRPDFHHRDGFAFKL